MIKPLFWVVVAGAAIGFMLPTGQEAATAPESNEASSEAKSGANRQSWPDSKPQETHVERRFDGHFYVTADVNGYPVDFVVDTGATSVALTLEDAQRVGIPFDRSEFTTVGRSASGFIQGQVIDIDVVDLDGKRIPKVRGAVLEGLSVSLLGQSYLSRITAVEMNGDRMVLR